MGRWSIAHRVDDVQRSIGKVKSEGGEILYGGEKLDGAEFSGGCYMKPASRRAAPRVRDRAGRNVRTVALSDDLP